MLLLAKSSSPLRPLLFFLQHVSTVDNCQAGPCSLLSCHLTSWPARHLLRSLPSCPSVPRGSLAQSQSLTCCVSLDSGPTCSFLLPLVASHKPSDSSLRPKWARPLVPVPHRHHVFLLRVHPHSATSPSSPDEDPILESGTPGPCGRPCPFPASQPSSLPLVPCFPNMPDAVFLPHTFAISSLSCREFPSSLPSLGIDLSFVDISSHKAGGSWRAGQGFLVVAGPQGHADLFVNPSCYFLWDLGPMTFPFCTLSFPVRRKG